MSRLLSHTGSKRQLPFSQPRPVKLRRQYDRANLHRAVEAMQSGMSAYRASRVYGVPQSTLKDRRLGNVTAENPGPSRMFTHKEEEQLVDHIKYMASIGYGYIKANIQYLASDLAVSLNKKVSSEKPLSDSWFYGFMDRWSDLKLAKPQKLSILRAKSASREVLDNYFKELSGILNQYNLTDKPERIYDIDETGINTEHAPPKVVCGTNSQPQAVTSTRSSTVTIIGGGNAVGNHIPPYFVFPGKRWNDQFLDGAPPGSAGKMSDSGWSNSDIFHSYITEHFVKHVNLSEEQKTLVSFDGHKSHISFTLVEWAKKHNIILFVLPPHTSHITQPLDIGVFGPLKLMYHRECQVYMQKNPGQNITKYEVTKLVCKPYMKALSQENLSSSFRKAGIFPFSDSTIDSSQVAPAIIYQKECEQEVELETSTCHSNENNPEVIMPEQSNVDKSEDFFRSRTITSVIKKPRKKFVPPFIAGNLSKKENEEILNSSKARADKLVSDKSSYVPKKVATKRSKLGVEEISKGKSVAKPVSSASPKPGPSAYYVDSSESESQSEDESSNCCVCHKLSPPALKQCVGLVIVKWAQCDSCDHWTHLTFCTDVSVVRRHSEFLCPHCQ